MKFTSNVTHQTKRDY